MEILFGYTYALTNLSLDSIYIGQTCKTCDWQELSEHEKAIIRQQEHKERMEQDYDY